VADSYLVYDKNRRHRLGDGICVLGRDPDCCDLAFDDQELSRKHAIIAREGARYLLIDFRSTNGVLVNDQPVEQVHLKPGDRIRIGHQVILYHEESAGSGSPSSSSSSSSSSSKDALRAAISRKDLERPPGPHASGSGAGSGSLTSILDLRSSAAIAAARERSGEGAAGNLAFKLATLIKVGRDLNSELKIKELMAKVIDNALRVMRADRGLLMLLDEAKGQMVPMAHREMETVMESRDARGHISRSIVELASSKREPILVKDALADQRFQTSLSIQMYNIRSALCVPLLNKDKFLGVLYVDNRIESFSFSDEDKELLTAFADQAAIGIENAKLVERIKEETRKSENLSRYLSKSIVKKILEQGGDLKLGGEKVPGTVLFADIRGFTSFSEMREPQQVVEFLNEFLTKMTREIFEYGGTLDKYLGDGLMAIFGAPFPMSDHPFAAIRAALAMQQVMATSHADWERRFGFSFRLGVGINTGEMTSGNIGSAERLDYTVIGDAVNLGARLQAMAVRDDIVISEFTFQHVRDRVSVESMGPVQVKGKSREVDVYRLLALTGAP
jgi:adenylate cyclase